MIFTKSIAARSLCGLLVFGLLLAAGSALAEDLKIEAKLIWGTNEEKSSDPGHKPVDKELAQKLSKIFKWKNYFVVSTINTNIPSRGTTKLSMSKVCCVEITELVGPKVEVKLIGKGQHVNTSVESLSKGSYFTIGGPDKNETAWFVVVKQF